MKIKYFLIIAVLAIAIFGFGLGVQAMGINGQDGPNSTLIAQLQAQIQSLMQQIQQIIAQQQGGQVWCHNFNTNLGFVNTGSNEVSQLHIALQKENISYGLDEAGEFTEDTGAAAVQFQAKYGIRQTGYVGPLTRAKLNALYGCGIVLPVCTPRWVCGWGPCVNSYQSQVPVDSNNCGLPSSGANTICPALAQACVPLGQCGTNSDCPTLQCFVAPCPIVACVSGRCVTQTTQPSITSVGSLANQINQFYSGDRVTVYGSGLPINAAIQMDRRGTVEHVFISATGNANGQNLTFIAPAMGSGVYSLYLISSLNGGSTISNAVQVTVLSTTQPSITSINPPTASIGSSISIRGINFDTLAQDRPAGSRIIVYIADPVTSSRGLRGVLWQGEYQTSDFGFPTATSTLINTRIPSRVCSHIVGNAISCFTDDERALTPGNYLISVSVDGRGDSNSFSFTIVAP